VATGGFLGAEAVADGPLFASGDAHAGYGVGGQAARTALVIDAALARDGRELVDPRLEGLDAEVRLPRSADEARANVRYFDALGYRIFVAGAQSTAAAERTGVDATAVDGLDGALAAAR
jgi:hypothetical protein